MECDTTALASLRANVAACRAGERARVLVTDVLAPPRGEACQLVFLDPPYGKNLIHSALHSLRTGGWIAPGCVVVAESGLAEDAPADGVLLAQRSHGAARVNVWRES